MAVEQGYAPNTSRLYSDRLEKHLLGVAEARRTSAHESYGAICGQLLVDIWKGSSSNSLSA